MPPPAPVAVPLPPPLPPKQGSTYFLYGQPYSTTDVLPSLDEQGVEQLYPKGDIEHGLKGRNMFTNSSQNEMEDDSIRFFDSFFIRS
eukprot:gene7477-8748_t